MKFKYLPLLAAVGLLTGTAFAGNFRASVVEVDITPTSPQWLLGYGARQSEGVHDHIYHRIAALDDGKTTIYLISSEVAVVSPGYADKIAEDIQTQLGIPPTNIWWMATHTHSAPEIGPPGVPRIFMPERYTQATTGESNPEYSKFAEEKLIEGVRQAREKLQPARLGIGTGYSTANINRRARDADGSIHLGNNPDGPVDRQIGLMRLESLDGKLIGLIANYTIHGTVLGGENREISGDAPGVVASYVEEKLGAPLVFINGAEGNVAPIYSQTTSFKLAHLGEFRVLLGDRILEANKHIAELTSDVSLSPSDIVVETPLRTGLKWPSELPKYEHVTSNGVSLVRIPVRFLQINHETVLWGAPLEMFCEISMAVRSQSRFPFTFYFGLTNGWVGYMPTAQGIRDKGYETETSPFTEQAESDFRDAVSAHIASLKR